MLLTIAAALQLAAGAAESAPPAPPEIAYVHIAGGAYRAVAPADRLLTSLEAEEGPRLRRAALDTDALDACLARSTMIDDAEHCVRALLPRRDGGAPVVAVFVEEDRRPNIIGTVVNKSLNVRCVGYRAVARAELDTLDRPDQIERARVPVRQCIAAATRTPAQASVDEPTGAATWRFPLREGGLIRDSLQARGNGLERAIVEIEETHSADGTIGGRCSLSARVSRVLGGWWLRAGDTVELGLPCHANGVRHARPALLFVNFERELHYLEPL
ncbi:MAG TPA: hypothetical protein VF702_03825 [Allosphingosinicella sp.]|jgi:hypothetical protein